MQSNEINLTVKGNHIQIFSVSCLHIGHVGHDKNKAYDYRDYILNTKNTYAISLGDDTENALPGDEKHNSMMWSQSMQPEEQYDAACAFWEPVAAAGKLLLTHDSNHWWRTEAKTGISMAKQMNIHLRRVSKDAGSLAPRWGQWMAYTSLRVNSQRYLIHSWHGNGGGTTPESALRNCRKQADAHHADVYLVGHYHKKIVYEDVCMMWPKSEHKPIDRKRAYACTGCFLNWNNSYAERAGLPPAMRGAVKLQLGAKEWDVNVSL